MFNLIPCTLCCFFLLLCYFDYLSLLLFSFTLSHIPFHLIFNIHSVTFFGLIFSVYTTRLQYPPPHFFASLLPSSCSLSLPSILSASQSHTITTSLLVLLYMHTRHTLPSYSTHPNLTSLLPSRLPCQIHPR